MNRKIIHIDMDAFFASVEQRDFPEYRGKPVIVGGPPEKRGVVAAASYEVRAFGVHSAMPSAQAKKLCPEAIFVYPRFEAYQQCSKQIGEIFQRFSDEIEPLSLDEAFLDVSNSGLFHGSATLIAKEIKRLIKKEVGLTASAGVSYCKFLAKIASDMDKPDGIFLIRPEQAEAFIAKLPIRKFFGIGKAMEAKMNKLGIYSGADLGRWNRGELQHAFGKSGAYYYDIVRGIDERPVQSTRIRKSLGTETTFAKDLNDRDKIWLVLERLTAKILDLMKDKNLNAQTLTLKVKYANFQQITRSITLKGDHSLCTEGDVLAQLPALMDKTDIGQRSVRLLGLTVSNFFEADVNTETFKQMMLL